MEDIYLSDERYYALVEALDRLRPRDDADRDGGEATKLWLGEVAGIWPAYAQIEQSLRRVNQIDTTV